MKNPISEALDLHAKGIDAYRETEAFRKAFEVHSDRIVNTVYAILACIVALFTYMNAGTIMTVLVVQTIAIVYSSHMYARLIITKDWIFYNFISLFTHIAIASEKLAEQEEAKNEDSN
jgi:hypothetical protein